MARIYFLTERLKLSWLEIIRILRGSLFQFNGAEYTKAPFRVRDSRHLSEDSKYLSSVERRVRVDILGITCHWCIMVERLIIICVRYKVVGITFFVSPRTFWLTASLRLYYSMECHSMEWSLCVCLKIKWTDARMIHVRGRIRHSCKPWRIE